MIKSIIYRLAIKCLIFFRQKNFRCNVCRNRVHRFNRLPDHFLEKLDEYGFIHPFFASETMNFLHYSCPICFSSDRDRLYTLYLEKFFENVRKEAEFRFLDIAPAPNLSRWIKKHKWINYRTVDLLMDNVDDNADITNMNIYSDEKFDFILCSHVLEHIEDDKKAISEIYRILKPKGTAIVMVPILLTLENDFENPEYKTESERWKYYGQNDHVRMYSKNGFVQKLKGQGFTVQQLGIDYFEPDNFNTFGIHRRSVLYVVNK